MTIRTTLKIVLAAIAACLSIEAAAGLVFLFSGLYNLAADQPHWAVARWILEVGKIRSVELRGRGEKIPNLRDASLVRTGLPLFIAHRQPCHGGPGVGQQQIGRGITPNPPLLAVAANSWTDSGLFWIVSHGLKMSGMPAFDAQLGERERWALVAFMRRMSFLSPAEYQQFAKAATDAAAATVHWTARDDYGFGELKAHGNVACGAKLLGQYGCATSHAIGGIGTGVAGPPLDHFAERQYVAGIPVNVPRNTSAWIEHPKRFKPATAMPELQVKPDEALDMTAYLNTVGSQKRLNAMRKLAAGESLR